MATNEDIVAMCATTQADVRNICSTLEGMKQFMSKQIDQHADTISRLSVIERVQNDMKENVTTYQLDCATDREAHDKRITAVEGFQGRQVKIAVGAGSLVAFLTAGGMKIFDRIFG